MTLRMEKITENQLDEEALNLRASMDRLMEREWLPEMGGHLNVVANQIALNQEWEKVRAGIEKRPLARCVGSGLDYLTHAGREIWIKTGKKPGARKKFRKHLALCGTCRMREECLEIALRFNEKRGIWGGKFPHERRTP